MRHRKLIPRWARYALLSLLLLLIVHAVAVALWYAGESGATMSPINGGIAAALVFAFVVVANSQTICWPVERTPMSPWAQLGVGMVMTVAQGAAFTTLYLVTHSVLATVTLSGGLFVVVSVIGIAYVPLILFLIWQLTCAWGRRGVELPELAPDANIGMGMKVHSRSQLIGAAFWLWLATIGAGIALLFGLDDRLAPYPVIGVTAGVYVTTFYVIFFALVVYQVVALYVRNRARTP